MTPNTAAAQFFTKAVLLLAVAVSAPLAARDAKAADLLLTQQLSALASGEGVPNGLFGWSVAIDDDIAVVADVGTLESPGLLRTYQRNGSTWTRMPSHDLPIPGDSGATISFRDGSLILSAFRSVAPSRGYAQIHRYTETGWISEYNLASSTEFYGSVATQGQIAVIGIDSYDGPAGTNQGRVRFVRRQSNGQWSSVYKLPTTPQAGAFFGTSVAIVSGAVVVGAPLESVTHGGTTYTRAGAAYVYELTGDIWNEVARLVEPSGSTLTDNRFANAVAISGTDPGTPDRMLISRASNETTGRAGIVRTYTRPNGTWTQKETIAAPTASATDGFGSSLALDGNWGVIGAQGNDSAASNAGAIFIARFNSTFSLQGMTQRTDPLAAADDFLGARVAVDRDGPTIVIGNLAADVYGNPNQGVVLVGHSDSGTTPMLSRAMDLGQGLSDANAGIVAFDGDTLLVGAYRENVGLQHQRGAVYEYRRMPDGRYAYQSRILAPDGMAGDFFGYRMVIQGDIAMISSIGRSLGGQSSAGAVYVFHRDAGVWSLEAQLLPATIGYEITFGFSLALDGSTAFIGEYGENTTVYQRSTGGIWTPVQSIPHRAWAVQLRGDLALLADSNTNDIVGDVAIYARSGGQWQSQGAINGSSANQGFGRDISLSIGNTLAVTSSTPATPVLLYQRTGNSWLPDASIIPTDVTSNTYCSRVALTATALAIGCMTSGSPGAVYVFEKNGSLWAQKQKLVLAPIQPNDQFGASLAWDPSGALFAGAPARDLDFDSQGAVYVYEADILFKNGFD